jgi:cyclase
MLKPRLIFTLLYNEGVFSVSRNFNLQSVGDLGWLRENYEFDSIARSIDELVILNVSRKENSQADFLKCIHEISNFCFMPIAIGGKIRNLKDAHLMFDSGADKLILNTPYISDNLLIKDLIKLYGLQAIVASIDFKRNNFNYDVFINNGETKSEYNLEDSIKLVQQIGAGELMLTSIDRDGTGLGYDLEALSLASEICKIPIIASGGADTYDKLVEGITSNHVDAVSTSHLFNFMGDGLYDAREEMRLCGINLSNWNFINEEL